MKRVHLIVSGDVQGVGFRAWIRAAAKSRQLAGWVKNSEDGSVEIVVEGSPKVLEEFVHIASGGPDIAWVKHVDVRWAEAAGGLVTFEVLY